MPQPKGSPDVPLRALIFDSWFDSYRGVIILMRILDGRIRLGQKIRQRNPRIGRNPKTGDRVVLTAGTAVNLPGSTNVIKVDVA